jgi:hypothetical protein
MTIPIDDRGHEVVTLRDWFAGQALVGLCAGYYEHNPATAAQIAESAAVISDEMMQVREDRKW